MEHFLNKADSIAALPTAPALPLVLFERHRGVVIVVERTEALVPHDVHSKSLGDPLNGEVAELLKFKLVHHS